MLTSVLEHIKENLLSQNPNTFQAGYAGARQYQDGKILIYSNFEGKYVGLKDNENNYFYLRYSEQGIDIDVAEGSQKSVSCTELVGTSPVRLVAWVKNANLDKLIDVLLYDLMQTDFSTMDDREKITGPKLFFSAIVLDPEQIYKDEVGTTEENDVQLVKNVTLVAIDFGVQFNYKLRNDDCIDRNVCVGCAA